MIAVNPKGLPASVRFRRREPPSRAGPHRYKIPRVRLRAPPRYVFGFDPVRRSRLSRSTERLLHVLPHDQPPPFVSRIDDPPDRKRPELLSHAAVREPELDRRLPHRQHRPRVRPRLDHRRLLVTLSVTESGEARSHRRMPATDATPQFPENPRHDD